QGITDAYANEVSAAASPFRKAEGSGRAVRTHDAQAELVGILDAEVIKGSAPDFEHLQLEHDLRVSDVEVGDEALSHTDGIGRVANDDGVELFIDVHVLRFHHGPHHVRDGFGVAIRDVEGPGYQLLIVPLLGGIVRVDEDHVVPEHLAIELVGNQQKAHDIVDAGVAHEDRRALIEPYLPVEDEIDTGAARDHFKNLPQRGVTEVEPE